MVVLRRRSVLYKLIGVVNILISLAEAYDCDFTHYSCYLTHRTKVNNRLLCCAGCGRVALWILTPVLWILDHPLAACRFVFRYTRKTLAARKKDGRDSKFFQCRNQRPGKASTKESDADQNPPPVLPYEVVRMIAADLHFVDLVSAARSSKRLRIGLFGAGGPNPSRLEQLRQFSCQGNMKRSCGLCGIQTCPVCAPSR